MKATVDPDRCQGHARCWDICPEVFEPDVEVTSYVRSQLPLPRGSGVRVRADGGRAGLVDPAHRDLFGARHVLLQSGHDAARRNGVRRPVSEPSCRASARRR